MICDLSKPPETITNSNYATIRFYADGSVNRDGFRFHWQPAEGECGAAIIGETSGSIRSPNNPQVNIAFKFILKCLFSYITKLMM